MNTAMKLLLAVVIIVGLIMGAYQIWEYWGHFAPKENSQTTASAPAEIPATQLPGLPPRLEPLLEASQKRGATGLHDFLLTYGKTISDPRLASIELDYVVLVAKDDPGEARRVFNKVKQRTAQTSSVYGRVKQLEKTYE